MQAIVKDERIVRFVRNHPNATAREVAQRFYTVKSQLVVGSRLTRLVNAGLLTKRFDDGWKYSAPSPSAGAAQETTTETKTN